MDKHDRRTIIRVSLASLILMLGGTVGFMLTAGLAPAQAFYETVMILLTHFDHYSFPDGGSRVLVIVLILSSYALIAYLLKLFAESIMGLSGNVRKLRVKAKVDKLSEHYIVCGLGRVGSQVAREMHQEGVSFVALDRDAAKVEEALAAGYLALQLDSSQEEALVAAGIERASGLVACLSEDSLNLFVTLAARSLNPHLYIVARANQPANEVKLKRAGADRVAMPYRIGGYHMASMALRPNVVDYMDIVSGKGGTADLEVEEMVVGERSRLAGHHLGKSLAEGEIGATVIAINGVDGTSRVRPTGKEMIYPGDRLIILGSKRDLTDASALIR
ncbi:MAG TPA: TrkA family potassium uptake protein [Candidatus Saccharimonadia bacterium]|nr:TrkA family potassium uptake protein [Candidatus Saccharimonadia bacterium]